MQVFEILMDAKTPLAISGAFAGILFFVIRQMLAANNVQWQVNHELLTFVVNKLFILALISLVLGFIGFLYPVINSSISNTKLSEKKISFLIRNEEDRSPLAGVSVNILNADTPPFISNENGLVKITYKDDPSIDSLELEFKSAEYGISYYPNRIALTSLPREFLFKISNEKGLDNNETTDIDSVSVEDSNSLNSSTATTEDFIAKMINLLYQIDFSATIQDVYAFEFGEHTRSSITFDALPNGEECAQNVRYFWTYLKDSKFSPRVNTFLEDNNLKGKITNDSYVLYVFADNSLLRTELRLYTTQSESQNLFEAFLIQSVADNNFFTEQNGYYYIINQSVVNGWSMTRIVLTNSEGFTVCNDDWWVTQAN